jgi:hypothetical protein
MIERIKLYVDDWRPCPPGWVLARTITEAIRILSTMDVTEVSLDHDIMVEPERHLNFEDTKFSPETFEPVARYIALHNKFGYAVLDNIIQVRFHTANPVGEERMRAILGLEIK